VSTSSAFGSRPLNVEVGAQQIRDGHAAIDGFFCPWTFFRALGWKAEEMQEKH
jgi:hypothetical protein